MESCKKCSSKKLKKIAAENLNEEYLDNIIETFECQECGHKEKEVIHIG